MTSNSDALVCLDETALTKIVTSVLLKHASHCLDDDNEREAVKTALILEIKKESAKSDR